MKIQGLSSDNDFKTNSSLGSKLGKKEDEIVSIVWENKKKWVVESVSVNIQSVFGFSNEDFKSSQFDFKSLIHPDDKDFVVNEINKQSRNEIGITLSPFRIITKSNKIIWVKNQVFVQNKDQEKATHFQGLFTSIESEIKLQEELTSVKKDVENLLEIQEQNDNLKSDFINNISHEIRTPINGIVGFSRLLEKSNLSYEKQKLYIDVIKNSCKQLTQIIDVIKISESGNKTFTSREQEFLVNDLLQELESLFKLRAMENNNTLVLIKKDLHSKLTILSDEVLIGKVLSNLIENAIKFTNAGSIEFGFEINKDMIDFFVKDSGIGIPADQQKNIFKRFTRLDEERFNIIDGSGLGLFISRKDAEVLGGKVTLKQEERKGSTFVLSIPFKSTATEQDNKIEANDLPAANNKKKGCILIVEDDDTNHLLLSVMLRDLRLGYSFSRAHNGQEAVDKCLINDSIELVLMDLNMPIMDGVEATRVIKSSRPTLPIIVQTAHFGSEQKVKAISSGCDEFLTKPICQKDVKRLVNKYLLSSILEGI